MFATVGDACCAVFSILAAIGATMPTLSPLGANWRTNQSRSDSSEMVTPKARSDSTIIRTEVPALRSRKSTVRYGSNTPALVVLPPLASAIKAASLWALDGLCVVIEWGYTGTPLGKAKDTVGELLGENLSAVRLDDGVSQKIRGRSC